MVVAVAIVVVTAVENDNEGSIVIGAGAIDFSPDARADGKDKARPPEIPAEYETLLQTIYAVVLVYEFF